MPRDLSQLFYFLLMDKFFPKSDESDSEKMRKYLARERQNVKDKLAKAIEDGDHMKAEDLADEARKLAKAIKGLDEKIGD